jgi:DUF971 family protein
VVATAAATFSPRKSLIFMNSTPSNLQALRELHVLRITWEGTDHDLPFAFLRRQCECAHCVNEWTGEQILDPNSIPEDISVDKMDLVGNYAVRVAWSDGHNSGLYTWQRLRELAQQL